MEQSVAGPLWRKDERGGWPQALAGDGQENCQPSGRGVGNRAPNDAIVETEMMVYPEHEKRSLSRNGGGQLDEETFNPQAAPKMVRLVAELAHIGRQQRRLDAGHR